MGVIRSRSKATKLAQTAMKWGILLTDVPLWEAVADDLRRATHSVRKRVRRKYDGRLEQRQEEKIAASLRSGSDWLGRATSLLAGVGIGVGFALLFAPQSGHDTREIIRDRAADFKDRIADAARHTLHFTGTNGD